MLKKLAPGGNISETGGDLKAPDGEPMHGASMPDRIEATLMAGGNQNWAPFWKSMMPVFMNTKPGWQHMEWATLLAIPDPEPCSGSRATAPRLGLRVWDLAGAGGS